MGLFDGSLFDRFLSRADTRLAGPAGSAERAATRTRHLRRMQAAQFVGQQLAADPRIAGEASAHTHPILRLADNRPGDGLRHETQLAVLHALRRYLPTLDSAIRNRRALEGALAITSDDDGLADALTAWAESVPVGYVDAGDQGGPLCGLADYVDTLASAADEYGLAAGEALLDEQGRDLVRLVVPCPRTLSLRVASEPERRRLHLRELVQRSSKEGLRALTGPTIQTLALTPDAEEPWPRPLAWSLVQTGEVLMRMYQSVLQGWWRFGDPSLLFTLEHKQGIDDPEPDTLVVPLATGTAVDTDDVEVLQDLVLMRSSIEAVMKARREGYPADAFASATNGTIRSETLGAVDATMARFFREHASTFGAYIVEASETPAWMYSSVERTSDGLGGQLSTNETILAGVAARRRNAKKRAVAKRVLDLYLTVTGQARYLGRYDVEFDVVSIVDDLAYAELRSEQAEGAATILANAELLFDEVGTPRFTGEAADYLREHGVL